MSNNTTAYIIRHRFRPNVFLGRKGASRDFPLVWAEHISANDELSQLQPLLRDDWSIVRVRLVEEESFCYVPDPTDILRKDTTQ